MTSSSTYLPPYLVARRRKGGAAPTIIRLKRQVYKDRPKGRTDGRGDKVDACTEINVINGAVFVY